MLDLHNLKQIGQITLGKLQKDGFMNALDILLHIPVFCSVQLYPTNGEIALLCTMESVQKLPNRFLIRTNNCTLVFLGKNLTCTFERGKQVVAQGYCSNNTFVHPKFWPADLTAIPIYKQSAIPNIAFNKIAKALVKNIDLPFPAEVAERIGYSCFSDLLLAAHTRNEKPALALLEGLAFNYTQQSSSKQVEQVETEYNLPVELTSDQNQAIQNIKTDFASGVRVHRMIFGDVGTGKTLVAVAAAMMMQRAGKRVLFLAPTTLLAKQAHGVFASYFTKTALLIQSTKKEFSKQKQTSYDIIIGTHALFEYEFENVGLVIIDEQHKFGVKQRARLLSIECHSLSLTATPIPRSLMQVLQGFMKVSVLRDKPKPANVTTYITESSDPLIPKIKHNLDSLILWVCPAVEERQSGLTSAVAKHKHLSKYFKAGLIHGQMKPEQQAEAYQQALDKKVQVLIATTVIEVGIDIPHADIIIIEDANRFGMAQLHQLRGRVGRGGRPGKCILISEATHRMKLVRSNSNGFDLANEDLNIRGYGKLFGVDQSGFEHFRFLDLDSGILQSAQTLRLEPIFLSRLAEIFGFGKE